MHEIITDELDRHLTGRATAAFYEHLESCAACRTEVATLDEATACLRELSLGEEAAPAPGFGFYARVANTIREQQPRSPLAGLFSPGVAFFRRVAFASAILLVGFGSLLVVNEAGQDGVDVSTLIAQYDPATAHAGAAEPDSMLVTLAAYHD